QPDFKECYFCAPLPLDETCQIQYPEVFADNLWPDGMPSFREDYLALGRELHAAGELLLRGCAAALDLPPETFGEAVRGGAHVSRLLRYLPVTDDQIAAGVLWGEEHTDFNLLTILPGGRFLDPEGAFCDNPDPESGLYLRTRADQEAPAGHKVRGVPPPGCLVAQVGQQLEILTGGAYLATPHVITAPRTPGYSRISAAHFVHLHPHRIVFPLEPFRNEETVAAYSPPVLAGTYGLKTLVDIGLAPPTALDKLGYRHYQRLEELRAR
ncbi:MAG: isopenicillin N synthase family oxygenase, partial [Myxococcales bacterium]|nr:isopenicillin N synthase family oxygenase [Myxococcales bacterium]